MLKLNAGFSRKIGEPNYGSRGASVNVELELESGLISDPDGLMGRIRNLFDIARRSVDAELASDSPSTSGRTSTDSGGNGHDRRDVRQATASQIRAIRAICDRQSIDPTQLARERFRVNNLQELTIREASALIDELKATPAGGRNGGDW